MQNGITTSLIGALGAQVQASSKVSSSRSLFSVLANTVRRRMSSVTFLAYLGRCQKSHSKHQKLHSILVLRCALGPFFRVRFGRFCLPTQNYTTYRRNHTTLRCQRRKITQQAPEITQHQGPEVYVFPDSRVRIHGFVKARKITQQAPDITQHQGCRYVRFRGFSFELWRVSSPAGER